MPKKKWHVWGLLACMDHTVFVPAHSGVSFPGLHCSGSRVLCRGTVQFRPCISCTSQVQAAQVLRYSARARLSWVSVVCHSHVRAAPETRRLPSDCPRWAAHLSHLPDRHQCPVSGVPGVSQGADLRLRPSWQMSTMQDPRKTCLATGSLLTVWWGMPVSGAEIGAAPRLQALTVVCLPQPPAGGGACTQPARSPLGVHSILCSVNRPGYALEPFVGKFSFFFSLVIPVWVAISRQLPQIVLREFRPIMQPTPPCSGPAHWWWMGVSGLLLLAVAVRHAFCGLLLFFFSPSYIAL